MSRVTRADVHLGVLLLVHAAAGGVGAGGSLLFRWHALNDVNWSLYLDGGLGILYSTNPVPQGGTQFRLELPVRLPEEPLKKITDQIPEFRPTSGKRILVVDDERTVLEIRSASMTP